LFIQFHPPENLNSPKSACSNKYEKRNHTIIPKINIPYIQVMPKNKNSRRFIGIMKSVHKREQVPLVAIWVRR